MNPWAAERAQVNLQLLGSNQRHYIVQYLGYSPHNTLCSYYFVSHGSCHIKGIFNFVHASTHCGTNGHLNGLNDGFSVWEGMSMTLIIQTWSTCEGSLTEENYVWAISLRGKHSAKFPWRLKVRHLKVQQFYHIIHPINCLSFITFSTNHGCYSVLQGH